MCVISNPINHEELELLAVTSVSAVVAAIATDELHSGNGSEDVPRIKHKRSLC